MAVSELRQVSSSPSAKAFGLLLVLGVVAGTLVSIFVKITLSPLVGWDTLAISYVALTWWRVSRLNADLVKRHALREDPSRFVVHAILVVASVVSLAAVGLLLASSHDDSSSIKYASAGLAVLSVISSWLMVHMVYALTYAKMYYEKPVGGIDFGTDEPVYSDFAYLALTIGMTFQVSDTGLTSRQFRRTALHHALLAYLLGTVIVAATINLVAGLGK